MNWFTNKILEAESSIKNVIGAPNLVKSSSISDEPVITAEMVEYVRNFCQHPKTFTDFPLDDKDTEESFVLLPWQENHARIILELAPELKTLRFKLCPSTLTEERFWRIYFLLLKNKIRENEAESSNKPAPEIPSTPRGETSRKLMSAFSPLFGFGSPQSINSSLQVQYSPSSKSSEIEDYYDNLMKESIDNSMNISFDGGIDPEMDNYFDTSFDESIQLNSSTIEPNTNENDTLISL